MRKVNAATSSRFQLCPSVPRLLKPDVDYIGGLSPSVSIQQKTAGRNLCSTVGTITEVSTSRGDGARPSGKVTRPRQRPITAQTREQIIGRVLHFPRARGSSCWPQWFAGKKGEFKDFFADMVKPRLRWWSPTASLVKLTDDLKLDKRIKHTIEIVVDRLRRDAGGQKAEAAEGAFRIRVAEAVEQAINLAAGNLIISIEQDEYWPA
ncbi:MAG: hypothetical protein U0792_00375 [Gemmataceae bacterium]